MTDADQIVENLINTEGIHAFVFVCEAADKYSPMVDSLAVQLANGNLVKLTDMSRQILAKVEETRRTLKREDRVVWALRFFKKALIEQILWMVRNDPEFFKKRFKSAPAPEQPGLTKQLQRLTDVDITPFQEFDPDDPGNLEPPYNAFSTIDAINARLGHYIKVGEGPGGGEHANPIHTVRLERQSFGEVVSLYRRGEIALRHRTFPGYIELLPTTKGPYDLRDKEGPVETLIDFPDGWKWVDLHRVCSPMRDDRNAPSDLAITGHCANTAGKYGETALELLQPLGNNRWKHHAFFILHKGGDLGERKGRKNQKPSPRIEKYIFELLRRDKRITGWGGPVSWNAANDFALNDLTRPHLAILKRERPELIGTDPQGQTPEEADVEEE